MFRCLNAPDLKLVLLLMGGQYMVYVSIVVLYSTTNLWGTFACVSGFVVVVLSM